MCADVHHAIILCRILRYYNAAVTLYSTDSTDLDHFVLARSTIPTGGAGSVVSFTVGTKGYLAVANQYRIRSTGDGSVNPANSERSTVDIYVYDAIADQFLLSQSLHAYGPTRVRHYTVTNSTGGTLHHLVVSNTNLTSSVPGPVYSSVFVLDPFLGSFFVEQATIASSSDATKITPLTVGGRVFLSVVDPTDPNQYNVPSQQFSRLRLHRVEYLPPRADYGAVVGGVATFAAGATQTSVTIAIGDDENAESTEWFLVNFSSTVGNVTTNSNVRAVVPFPLGLGVGDCLTARGGGVAIGEEDVKL